MTIDEAISHCLEVAEQNETQADKIGRQLIGSAIDKYATDCRECAADHRQLAEWLTELKDLRKENKVLSKVSGGEICQLEEQIKDWKEEYAYINKLSYGYYKELKEAKLLLKKAIDDFKELDKDKLNGKCMMPSMDCACCPLNWDSVDDKAEPCHNWRYTNEALKIIRDANGEEKEDNK